MVVLLWKNLYWNTSRFLIISSNPKSSLSTRTELATFWNHWLCLGEDQFGAERNKMHWTGKRVDGFKTNCKLLFTKKGYRIQMG